MLPNIFQRFKTGDKKNEMYFILFFYTVINNWWYRLITQLSIIIDQNERYEQNEQRALYNFVSYYTLIQ